MANDFVVTDLKPDLVGIREVLHTAPVAEMCREAAHICAAKCNALLPEKYLKHGARFDAKWVNREYTAAGLVYCSGSENGKWAGRANAKLNILKKGCNG
ncbi:hypothetical protein Apar_0583 [Lancefieldella parvula DSM 20469]|uniref:Uncharacterized protein n=1 Tax=Lancefieldella parvula (strain ATCC 33793 / DSM 20469 / CCUG 32760 / JCM 10300 / KCTC 3663 / VPI 0546 / 1246) TaxID=521095 RepID=C8WA75_LANP1|nr:hypothetical protein [Lancefieldella parvula]ACV51013.1 hypothetical protein Apar_0583 [Lancefieldella parvula DSM 20469]